MILEQTDVMPPLGGLRFRLVTGRLAPDDPDAVRRRAAGLETLALLDAHLASREFLAGDYEPYPENARPGRSRAVYD